MKRESMLGGVAVAFAVHALLVTAAFVWEDTGDDAFASSFEGAETIEASLAFKTNKIITKQPQKKRRKKFKKPDAIKISRDADAKVEAPKKDEEKVRAEPEELDPASILEKNRKQDEDLSSTGVDELPQEGSTDGSEWGTEKDARGDPYMGELKGRVYSAWKLPALEKGQGTAEGCVRLSKEGKILERLVRKRSENANIDRSVELALREAPDMDEPVPDHLLEKLTVRGQCFNFTP